MPPSTEPSFASDGKWSLYLDKEDSFSLPPSERKRPFVPYSISLIINYFKPPITGRPKAKSKAGSKANLKSSGARPKKTDGDSEKNDSDADTPQDGRGDPNLSGITPPLPVSLVEPQLVSYDTGFHVITAGIEVGITTVKFVYISLLFSPPNRLFFHLFPEEWLTRASPAKAHRPRRSRPGSKCSHTTTSVSTMVQSLFAPRCKIRLPCKAQCERSGKSGPSLWNTNLSPNRPSPPLSTLRRPRVLPPNQSMSRPPKALQNLSLRAHTRHYFFPNRRQSFPNLLTAESVHMLGLRLFPKPTMPLVALGNTLHLPGFRLFPILSPMSLVPLCNTLSEFPELGNTLNNLSHLPPLRHHIPRGLSAISTLATSSLNPRQMTAMRLI